MKYFVTLLCMLLLPCLIFCQTTSTPIYSIENGVVIEKPNFISNINNTNYSGIETYTLVSDFSFQTSKNHDNYLVSLYDYNGWSNEPGDFVVVDIKKNNRSIFQYTNQDGWVTQPTALCPVSGVNYYYEQLDSLTTLLYFVGYAYSNNPGFLTLIIVRNGQAKVVFNKPFAVTLIEKANGVFTINMEDDFAEYGTNGQIPANTPKTYKILWDNGMLKFNGPY